MDLFDFKVDKKNFKPLAERLKPEDLSEFFGQDHILSDNKLLRRMIEADKIKSIILYGPPGTGKTSIAKIIASKTNSEFRTLNAVISGIKDIKEVIEEAIEQKKLYDRNTILFIDEIHRFNKKQQDALLPYVEDGTVILIGATTENPFFEVNKALISRSTVFELQKLDYKAIRSIVLKALHHEKGFKELSIDITEEAIDLIVNRASGDARRALNILELAVLTTKERNGKIVIDKGIIAECSQKKVLSYDKDGDEHYNLISAFIKSMRGSDPNATMHYLARLIKSGEDVKFIARRLIICASEDVGLADSNALIVAKNAFDAVHIIGFPEARIILAHAALYIAKAPKSNSAYLAIDRALYDIDHNEIGDIPPYLKDFTANKLSKDIYNKEVGEYLYPHNYENHYVNQQYLPDNIKNRKYYRASKNDK